MKAESAGACALAHQAGRVALGLLAALLGAVAGCGSGGAGLDEVHAQNRANLTYPADDDEAALRALHERLTVAANASYGQPAGIGDQPGVHRETWCLPTGTSAEPGLGGPLCTAQGPGTEQLQISWLEADPDATPGTGVDEASLELGHSTDRYQFGFDTAFESNFALTAPGLGSFDIVAARYTLDVEGTNLPTIYSQPVADSARGDLLAYLASPQDLAANATAKLETLRAQTQEWLDLPGLRRRFNCETKPGIEGQVTECDEAELSAAERGELRATVDAMIDGRIVEVQANAEPLHALLVEATLADRCPACWG